MFFLCLRCSKQNCQEHLLFAQTFLFEIFDDVISCFYICQGFIVKTELVTAYFCQLFTWRNLTQFWKYIAMNQVVLLQTFKVLLLTFYLGQEQQNWKQVCLLYILGWFRMNEACDKDLEERRKGCCGFNIMPKIILTYS